MTNKFSIKSILAILLILIAIIIYFVIIINASINFPVLDDYPSILSFLINYDNTSSLLGKCNAIYTQHNEHRIVFGKILTLCYYKILGELNFIHLIFLGNIPLVGIVYILFKSLKIDSFPKKLVVFVPLTIFLFNYAYYEVSCWAMASIQNIWVLFFAFLSLYLLNNENKKSILWACIFASIATFTSGNGILVFITGILFLILRKEKKSYVLLWLTFFLINAFVYFIGLSKVGHHPSFIKSFIAHPLDLLLYPMNFIGSLFLGGVSGVGIVIGFGVIACCLLIWLKKIYAQNYVLFSFLIFMLLTVVAVTVSRFGFGIIQSSSSRYMINSTLIFIIVALLFTQYYQSKLNHYHWFGAFILVVIFNIYSYQFIENQREVVNISTRNIHLIKNGKLAQYNLFYAPGNETQIADILSTANLKGIFKTDSIGYSTKLILNTHLFKIDTTQTRFSLDEFKSLNDSIYRISGWMLRMHKPSYHTSIAIGLEDSLSNMYIVIPSMVIRNDVTNAFMADHCNYNYSGFTKDLHIHQYPKGEYTLSFLIMSDGVNLKIPIHKKIKI